MMGKITTTFLLYYFDSRQSCFAGSNAASCKCNCPSAVSLFFFTASEQVAYMENIAIKLFLATSAVPGAGEKDATTGPEEAEQ